MNELEHRRPEYFLACIAECGFPSWIHFLEVSICRDNARQIRYQVEEPFEVAIRLDDVVFTLALVPSDVLDGHHCPKAFTVWNLDPRNRLFGRKGAPAFPPAHPFAPVRRTGLNCLFQCGRKATLRRSKRE